MGVELEPLAPPGMSSCLAPGPDVHPLTDEPWGVRRFFVRDPNGKVINVMTHIKEE